jgi:predicted NACHT family NTPase
LHPNEDECIWKEEAEKEAQEIYQNIIKDEHIAKLATNPLMLQMIACISKDHNKTLPNKWVELYGECLDINLEHWDKAKNIYNTINATEVHRLLNSFCSKLTDFSRNFS